MHFTSEGNISDISALVVIFICQNSQCSINNVSGLYCAVFVFQVFYLFIYIYIYIYTVEVKNVHTPCRICKMLIILPRGITQNACYCLFSTDLNKIFHIKDVYM